MRALRTLGALAILTAALVLLQGKLEALRPATGGRELILYLPSGKYLRPAALGFDTLVADLLWLRAVSYFGKHYLTDRRYDWLYHMVDIVTTLDPKFLKAYTTGGLILSIEVGDVEKSNRILLKGMEELPDEWTLPFYLGFNHFYYLSQPLAAAQYLQRAASLPGHPRYLPRLAATLLAEGGEREAAAQFLLQLYRNTKDERLKEELEERIRELKAPPEGSR